ncbi:sulfurtransferase TusA family protein [uncultured Bilophila sp.]|uniref:sulfurtransferase TusA family protein n=1 Tax=uncultured Bilophila sp. TaxID=529385 RepID=UPI00280B383C|nr:sulfurtransferase TusA family protein [uncultured Bilophila sp.]
MRTVDTRGLSCPQPLILFHQAIAENTAEPLDVLVDNEASLENVTRAAEKKGWNVTSKDKGEGVFRLELRK